MTTPNFNAGEKSTLDLEDWGRLEPPLAEPISGDLATYGEVLWADEALGVSTGTWECAPGESRWDLGEEGEFIHVLSGRMTCNEDGGDSVILSAGSTAVFPPGWKGTWVVHETLRKVYVMFK